MPSTITDVTTGLDLKLLRIERGITQEAVALQMGVWRQTVSIIEAALRPGPDRIARYLTALDEATELRDLNREALAEERGRGL
jgi:transcriptional regulator with XRE-family HTH domain